MELNRYKNNGNSLTSQNSNEKLPMDDINAGS